MFKKRRPDQVHNCTLANISMTSLTVTCTDGFNGGLPQLFILELVDTQTNEIKANITSTIPRFTVSTLSPGGLYTLSVYAFNSKGRSDPTILSAAMLRMPEKQLTFEPGDKSRSDLLVSPMISLTVGLTLVVLVAGLAVILALRVPCNSSRRRQKEFPNDQDSRNGSPGPSEKSAGSKELESNDDEKNPDVVPESMDPNEQIDYIRRKQQISTIESSCSPTRNLLTNTPPPQQYASGMTLHSSHNMGYCTLRSGLQTSSVVGSLSMSVTPHVYSSSIAQCTLPRHTNQHLWTNYNNILTGVGHLQPITTMHQQTLPTTSNMNQIPTHSEQQNSSTAVNAIQAANMSSMTSRTHNFQPGIQQIHRARVCVDMGSSGIHTMEPACLSDEEVTAQTPLMMKRESTV
ncbi:uncharacterized protein LOC124419400 [Lucilia cuprina]|uniref:uncharacterized protein LOC124419400 n=1 Tax=Lucilia cuprina TaxID=7375 RepID=UPI001F06A961|nr:uncharacterized protein LOC124419400 [Lucilia cuprina]